MELTVKLRAKSLCCPGYQLEANEVPFIRGGHMILWLVQITGQNAAFRITFRSFYTVFKDFPTQAHWKSPVTKLPPCGIMVRVIPVMAGNKCFWYFWSFLSTGVKGLTVPGIMVIGSNGSQSSLTFCYDTVGEVGLGVAAGGTTCWSMLYLPPPTRDSLAPVRIPSQTAWGRREEEGGRQFLMPSCSESPSASPTPLAIQREVGISTCQCQHPVLAPAKAPGWEEFLAEWVREAAKLYRFPIHSGPLFNLALSSNLLSHQVKEVKSEALFINAWINLLFFAGSLLHIVSISPLISFYLLLLWIFLDICAKNKISLSDWRTGLGPWLWLSFHLSA